MTRRRRKAKKKPVEVKPVKPIALFRLDLLALEEVLKQLESVELFRLSLCSKRSTRIAQRAIKRRKTIFEIDFSIFTSLTFRIREYILYKEHEEDEEEEYELERWDLDCMETYGLDETKDHLKLSNVLFETRCPDRSYIKWEDVRSGYNLIAQHLLDLLSPRINFAGGDTGRYTDIWIDTMEEIKARNLRIKAGCLVMKDVKSEHEMSTILDFLPLFKNVRIIEMKPSDSFILSDVHRKYEHDKFEIEQGQWIRIEHLLNMNCKTLEIREPSVNEKDLAALLNFWIDGGMSNLEKLELKMKKLELSNVMRRVPHERNDQRIVGNTLHTPSAVKYDIRRTDGTTACVFDSVSGFDNRRFFIMIIVQ